jgi:uncharacterized C2H2 Zn-finger protein
MEVPRWLVWLRRKLSKKHFEGKYTTISLDEAKQLAANFGGFDDLSVLWSETKASLDEFVRLDRLTYHVNHTANRNSTVTCGNCSTALLKRESLYREHFNKIHAIQGDIEFLECFACQEIFLKGESYQSHLDIFHH